MKRMKSMELGTQSMSERYWAVGQIWILIKYTSRKKETIFKIFKMATIACYSTYTFSKDKSAMAHGQISFSWHTLTVCPISRLYHQRNFFYKSVSLTITPKILMNRKTNNNEQDRVLTHSIKYFYQMLK